MMDMMLLLVNVRSGRPSWSLVLLFMISFFLLIIAPNTHAGKDEDGGGQQQFGDLFYQGWGPQDHMVIDQNNVVSMYLDRTSGTGFQSKSRYKNGYFGASFKVPNNRVTSGINANFYLWNADKYPGRHDEVDFEFLGAAPGGVYILQTNVYADGSGDGFFTGATTVIGREMQFNLSFDPSQDFHHYAFLKTDKEIIFYVDDIPIRRYPNVGMGGTTYPAREMSICGSIWDASGWATENGKYGVDYTNQPFISHYTHFTVAAAADNWSGGLSKKQKAAMTRFQKKHMVYNYCDSAVQRNDFSRTPECHPSFQP